MSKILIIEDEIQILDLLKLELSHEGYTVDTASDGKTGIEKIESGIFDLVLLDIMLPQLNGIEVCRKARKFTDIPIIMLTSRDQMIDKVTGLDMGADDYITKPFSTEELLARIRGALRRNTIKVSQSINLEFKNISINRSNYEVRINNEILDLTKTEYQLLVYLVENKNQILTREQILNAVWGYEYFGNSNVVDVYVRYLRNKFNEGSSEKYITTVRGIGFIMKES
jgi:two-component system, OmpR family, response regulator ArlR